MSELVLKNWKNGVLVNKEHKFRKLAKLTVVSELILALLGSVALSQVVVSFHLNDAGVNCLD
jgi:hypothetical protein